MRVWPRECAMFPRRAVMVVVAADGGAAVNLTVAVATICWPSIVPETVAVLFLLALVSDAEYVPFPLSVTAESMPRLVDRVTASPPTVSDWPLADFAWTVID